MNQKTDKKKSPHAWQTTGHTWDGDLQEFNQPIPRWWLWAFYATVVFAIVYWLLFPSWPIGETWLKGFSSVSYTVEGEEQEMRWNSRSKLLETLHASDAAERRNLFMEQVAAAGFEEIRSVPETLAFVRSVGTGLFGDNCAACHGRGGQGVIGMYPNLADDAWLWGGTMEEIQETLIQGRQGFMPAFKETFIPEQADDVAEYVLTLSNEAPMSEAAERGGELFQGEGGGCYYCHGRDAKGLPSQGAPNLTDKIWTIADVPVQETLEGKKEVVREVIWNGVQMHERVMPAWEGRLSPAEIKVLAVYVHQLGGGQ